MFVDYEVDRMRKEAIVTYFNLPHQHMKGGTEETHEILPFSSIRKVLTPSSLRRTGLRRRRHGMHTEY